MEGGHEKRPRSDSADATVVDHSLLQDGRDCPICLEPWGVPSSGHRIAVLKCGHLFGRSCIERWIGERKTCPNCHAAAARKDIRLLYVSSVSVMDTSKVDNLMTQLEEEKRARAVAEMEKVRLRVQLEQLVRKNAAAAAAAPPRPPSPMRQKVPPISVGVSSVGSTAATDDGGGARWKQQFALTTNGSRICCFTPDLILVSSSAEKGSAASSSSSSSLPKTAAVRVGVNWLDP